jgi:hypothetical protein
MFMKNCATVGLAAMIIAIVIEFSCSPKWPSP